MLEEIADDDKQTYLHRFLNELLKKNDYDFYNIPAIQALICYHHAILQSWVFTLFNGGLKMFEIAQVYVQMVIVNDLIAETALQIENEESTIVYMDTPEVRLKMYIILIFSTLQLVLVLQRFV